MQGVCRRISELTGRYTRWLDTEEQIGRLNQLLRGWSNYFRVGAVTKAYRLVANHTERRLRQWLCKKHQVRGRGFSRFSDEHLHQQLGLLDLTTRKRGDPCA